MKTAVVFYSLEGNTKFVAEQIAENLGADLIQLEPEKPYPTNGLAKYFHGGKSAVFEQKPALKPYTFNSADYDYVIIGCPVWASNCAAPMNTFFDVHAEALRTLGADHISLFICQSGKGAEKVAAKIMKILQTDNVASKMVLIDPVKRPTDTQGDKEMIVTFCDDIKKKLL